MERHRSKLMRIWDWLTRVHPSITDPQERREARIFLAMLCVLPLFELTLFVLRTLTIGSFTIWSSLAPLITIYNTIWLWLLGRTRYTRLTIRLTIVLNVVSIFALIVLVPDPMAFETLPPYLTLSIFLASMFFSWRAALVVALVSSGGVLLLGLLDPRLDATTTANHERLLIMTSAVTYMAGFMLRHAQSLVQIQADALANSEARYRSLFDASLEPLIVYHEDKVIDLNREFEVLFGYTSEEVRGQPVVRFLHPDDLEKLTLNSGTPDGEYRHDLRFIRKDGSEFYGDVRTKPHVHQGQQVRVASVRDMTVLRELEAQRLEMALESDRDAVLQKLLSNLSHDFRTPLSVIKTSLYLLERTTNDPVKHGKQIEVVRLQAKRLQEMLDDFMTLVRLDYARKGDMEDTRFTVETLIADLIHDHEAAAEKRLLTMQFEPLSPLPPVYASEFTLRRILKRIMTNAVNYSLPGGTITVRAELIYHELCISVEDTGVGISPEDLPHIFDHFYRADKSRNTESGGAGLGLTIAHKLAEMIGGSIEVVSAPNEGSTFTVRLPVQVAEIRDLKPHSA
ncbi:MAG: PAS domain-containing sensor histidine kinase [Chloroflexota bacterium]|nr:PAS domain-containing sensor histidine kinase [Chloroflexota bacterium]